MCIGTIKISKVTGETCFLFNDPFSIYDMLDEAGLSNWVHVGSFGEYENCIVFEKTRVYSD